MRIGDLNTVGQAVETQEGYYPGTLAYTNNNPGNLAPAGQPGCSLGAGGFCAFPDYATGYQALLNQVSLDASRGYTILQFATKYLGGDPPYTSGIAPGGDAVAYAQAIASAAGVSPNDLLSTAIASGAVTPDLIINSIGSVDPTTMAMLAVGGALLLAWALG